MVDDLAHHAAAAAELVAELGPVDHVPASIVEKAIAALLQAATIAVDAGRLPQAVRHASRALDLHQADPETERQLLLVRATAELDQRLYAEAISDAEQVLEGGDGRRRPRRTRPRPGAVSARSRTCRATSPPARQQLDCAIELFRELGEPGPLADGLRARGFAEVFGGSLTDAERVPRRGDGDLPRARRRARPRLDPPEPRLGRVPVRRLRGRRDPAARGRGAVRRDRRPQRRQLGAGTAGLRVVLPAPVRRRRDARRRRSRARPGGGVSRGRR